MDVPSGAERSDGELRPVAATTDGTTAGAERTGSGVGADSQPSDPVEMDEVDDVGDVDDGSPDPLRFHRWMRTSSAGGVLTGIALGLQHALEEHREQPAFVMEAPGEPEDPDAPIVLHFDPDDPTRTVAVVRRPPATEAVPPSPDRTAADGSRTKPPPEGA